VLGLEKGGKEREVRRVAGLSGIVGKAKANASSSLGNERTTFKLLPTHSCYVDLFP